MSASVANLPTQYNLLPMPTGIGIDDSFSRDLLRQFDRRRSRLQVEMAQLENRHSIHIIPIPSPSSSSSASSQHQNGQPTLGSSPIENGSESSSQRRRRQQQERDDMVRRRSSAGDLLRRSSAYLRAKWKILRSEESNFSTASLPSPPSKIAINTTISIPHFHHLNNNNSNQQQQLPPAIHYATVQPPVITQYPPKPLVYAPVEPMEDVYQEDHRQQQQKQRNALHRISLPVLGVHRSKSLIDKKKKRRFSDSVDQQQHRSVVGSSCDTLGQKAKKWTQFINCRPLKKSKKGKERVTLTTTTASNGGGNMNTDQSFSSS